MTPDARDADDTDDMPLAEVIEPAAIVEADETPVELRVTVGYHFDVEGTLDLHESGKVTLHATGPDWRQTLRNGYVMCWRGDESRPPADILRELPRRWKNYLWAGVSYDRTGDTGDTTTTIQTEHLRLWLQLQLQLLHQEQERHQGHSQP